MVAHGLGRDIVAGRLRVDAMLPCDAELTERFRVSRTVLREAMKTLAAKGMLEPKTRVGTRVLGEKHWNMFDADILAWRMACGVDSAFLAHLFEIRQAFEPLAAASAAMHRTADDIIHMSEALDAMRRPGHSRDSFALADLAFHRTVLDASANPFLQAMGSVIRAALTLSFTISSPVDEPERFVESGDQHRKVLDAIANGRAQDAAAAMTAVIVQGAMSADIRRPMPPSIAIEIEFHGA
jgi:DNA-binding FadR family transcriptional regulator